MENGIIKQWNPAKRWGIIYATGDRRFFLHASKVIRGTPDLFRRAQFEVVPARHAAELPQAVQVVIGDEVIAPTRETVVRQ